MFKLRIYSPERIGKIILYVMADTLVLNISLLVAMGLWYTGLIPGSQTVLIPPEAWVWFKYMSVAGTAFGLCVYAIMGMYNNLWKYASIDEILKIFVASAVIFVFLHFYNLYFVVDSSIPNVLRRLLFVAWLINTLLVVFSRFGYRTLRQATSFLGYVLTSKAGCKRVMIVGAGFSGYGMIRSMRSSRVRDKMPVIVVDDDPGKNNTYLMGVRVLQGTNRIEEYAKKFLVDEIIIAMPSKSKLELKAIIDCCTKTDCLLKIMPPMSDVSEGLNTAVTLRNVNISDLLYREEVALDSSGISEFLTGKVVLITGGGGSIGSELCRQISRFTPQKMIIFDIYENNAYELLNELKTKYQEQFDIVIRIGSVRDKNRIKEVLREFNPQVVFHAAAHKHVPLMEESPAEAVKNNVLGTLNVARCADEFGVDRFVLLSTDKAVNPANVMGATKRVTELIIQSMSKTSKTKFMAVRFGNVLGSNGSVIPLFKKQIEDGGPVTVTHPEMVRFFMTIPEAAQLVLQAAATAESGRIFVLDMGSPVKIADLARNLIRLSGLRPDKDIEIKYTGLRPGEKLYEELILSEEKDDMQVTCHKKIFVTKPVQMDDEKFKQQLEELERLAFNEPNKIESYLHVVVPNYMNGHSKNL